MSMIWDERDGRTDGLVADVCVYCTGDVVV
jgi:hypothetical protein